MNIPTLTYWDRSFAMVDVVRHGQFRTFNWGYDVSADADGAPGQDFLLIFNSETIGPGTYKLMFVGQADIDINAQPQGQILNHRYDRASNRSFADVVMPGGSTNNTWLTFRNTRRTSTSLPGDGVTKIQLWRPGYPTDGSQTFTKEFLEAMKKFKVLRTMDWINANANPSVKWGERTLPEHIGMAGDSGQSWEFIVNLANATGKDLWITVPVKADDDYIRNLVLLLRYGSDGVNPYASAQITPRYAPLRSDLKLYVEYGNEIWNTAGGFMGFRWALELANQHRLDKTHPISNDGLVTDQYVALRRWIAYRSAFISQQFRKIWGDGAMMNQIRPVLTNQPGDANVYLSTGLQWAEGFYGNVTKLWWGGGGSAYYESTVEPVDLNPGTMQAYFDGLPNADYAKRIAIDSVWLKGYGLQHAAYEGGPEPGAKAFYAGKRSPELSYAYNADPRMADRMKVAYDQWVANGGDLFVFFTYSSSAPWSFSDGTKPLIAADNSSVKLRFIDGLANQPAAAPVLGAAVPGVASLRDPASAVQTRIKGSGAGRYGNVAFSLNANEARLVDSDMILVPIRTTKAGRYTVALTTLDSPTTARVQVFVNGVLVGELAPSASSPTGTPATSAALQVDLPAGISVVRLRAKTGLNIWVRDLVVQAG